MNKQDKYREALQNRSIQPSQSSWEQLSEKLNAHENTQKGNKWVFLKYAAVILILMSVGFYFLKPANKIVTNPVIVAPTIEEDIIKTNKIPKLSVEPEIRVAETSPKLEDKTVQKKHLIITPENTQTANEAIALNKNEQQLQTPVNNNMETKIVEMPTEAILIVEQPSEEALLNAEVDQLLKASKIKLIENRQISNKSVVSADALLTEIEDDLDKDFKEKLIENIVNTIKKPRQVVITDRGN